MKIDELQARITELAADPRAVKTKDGKVVDKVIDLLDKGRVRVSEPNGEDWVTHAWVKQAILLYFARRDSEPLGDGRPLAYFDKIRTKTDYGKVGVRCVPPGVARYGSYLARGVILMPGYVNIGAYVDEGTMVDTWATVGSCAQIGKGVHLSGGVGIGGVLEPPQAQPVIIEDGAFVGSRCIVVEGVRVGAGAVLGAGVVLTASTSGTLPKSFPAGEYGAPCALVIGTRSEETNMKVSLEQVLRDYEVAV
jgi:2,3,4,5-tetrahydropyridine-2-carboxylate N-succinyltransferase